ncbi:MAG: hypothetical protein HYR90_00270 [Candidatus Andersenbacteria bacterium]|nr:hypothetical protein [Candidatus Andersenbacteria bacterium]MBI3250674.1 hypothetical protein [Candidatus Andersenbacteria bacterium]
MKKIIQKKITSWQQRPEAERLRIATLLTWGGGATMIVLWLVVLLPLQLAVGRDDAEPRVQGTVDPTPSVSVSPSISPYFP